MINTREKLLMLNMDNMEEFYIQMILSFLGFVRLQPLEMKVITFFMIIFK